MNEVVLSKSTALKISDILSDCLLIYDSELEIWVKNDDSEQIKKYIQELRGEL